MLLQLSSIFSSSKQLNLSRGGGAWIRKYNGVKICLDYFSKILNPMKIYQL